MNSKEVNVQLIGISKGKLKAYFHEFGFLKDYLPRVLIDLKTSRINEVLLSREQEKPQGASVLVCERIIFLDFSGKYVGEVGVKHVPAPKRTWKNWFPKSYDVQIKHEAVYQAVLRLEEENRERIPWYDGDYRLVRMINWILSVRVSSVTVYKPPKLEELERGGHFPLRAQEKLLQMATSIKKQNTSVEDIEFKNGLTEIWSS